MQDTPAPPTAETNVAVPLTKLGLSKYVAEAAEQAAEHQDKLGIAVLTGQIIPRSETVHGRLLRSEKF